MEFMQTQNIKKHFKKLATQLDEKSQPMITGTITRISGMKIEAVGLIAPVGTLCQILLSESSSVIAEIIGFSDHITYLMAIEPVEGIQQGTVVIPMQKTREAKVGMGLLGRIIDATGQPIDGKGEIETTEVYPLITKTINPLSRKKISEVLDVGIKAINALMTVSKGQRLGIFAGSGYGKSVLLGMMTRFTNADIVVVGLVGERGREVKEFIEDNLGESGLQKTVVVAAPADTSPLMRVNCANLSTTIAEYYRDKGFDVLLIVDSLTRYAQAQREISLSVGEVPTTKGFTPTVFAKLSQLVERSGNGSQGQGSITSFYTILIEGEELTDPVADHARSVLDGHILLSKQLAEEGHYPAIDVERSISRVMTAIVSEKQLIIANLFKRLYSRYQKNKDLINVGMYQIGSDKVVDEAIRYKEVMENYLKQNTHEQYTMSESLNLLYEIFKDKLGS